MADEPYSQPFSPFTRRVLRAADEARSSEAGAHGAAAAHAPPSGAPAGPPDAPSAPPAASASGAGSAEASNAPPSDDEVAEYALHLGFSSRDPCAPMLLWIAEAALVAPLPPGWKQRADHRDRAYYVDPVDGSYQADHPFDGDYRELYRALSSALANASKTPTKGEVEEMAAYLGIAERPALAWVAQQAVLAPLPEGWEEREGTEAASTADGGTQAVDGGKDEPAAVVLFYYDKKTGQSSREHPLDPTFRRLATIEAMRLDELVNAAALGERGEGPRMEAPDLEAMSWMHLADDENGQLYEYNWMTGKRVDLDLADEAAVAEVGADGGIEEVVASAGASDGAQVQAVPSVRDVHTGALRPAVSDAALEFDKLAADDQADDEGDSKAATPTPASLPPGARRMPLTTRSKSVRRSPLSRSASGNVKLPPLRSTQYVSHAEAVETLQSAVGAASAYVAGWARYALGSVTGAKGDDAK